MRMAEWKKKTVDFLENIAYNNTAGRNTLYTRVIELTFKRHNLSPTTRPPFLGGFF